MIPCCGGRAGCAALCRVTLTRYERVLVENATSLGLDDGYVLSAGGQPSSYSRALHETYGFCPGLSPQHCTGVLPCPCPSTDPVCTALALP